MAKLTDPFAPAQGQQPDFSGRMGLKSALGRATKAVPPTNLSGSILKAIRGGARP